MDSGFWMYLIIDWEEWLADKKGEAGSFRYMVEIPSVWLTLQKRKSTAYFRGIAEKIKFKCTAPNSFQESA